jgi:hypothetical protein
MDFFTQSIRIEFIIVLKMCHINPATWVVLVAGYGLVVLMRRILHMTMFHWIDVGIISLMILLAFSYQADPDMFHRTGTRPLAGLMINYLYKFVVVCPK